MLMVEINFDGQARLMITARVLLTRPPPFLNLDLMESKICIQLSSSIHREYGHAIQLNPQGQ